MPKKEPEYPVALVLRVDTGTRKKLEAMAKAELRTIAAMARIVLLEGIAAREMKSVKPRAPKREEW